MPICPRCAVNDLAARALSCIAPASPGDSRPLQHRCTAAPMHTRHGGAADGPRRTRRLKKMEARREAKAEKAADLTGAIEAELMTRLKSGTYGDIYNFPMAQYNRVLDSSSMPDEQEAGAGKVPPELLEGGSGEGEEEEYDSEVRGRRCTALPLIVKSCCFTQSCGHHV